MHETAILLQRVEMQEGYVDRKIRNFRWKLNEKNFQDNIKKRNHYYTVILIYDNIFIYITDIYQYNSIVIIPFL